MINGKVNLALQLLLCVVGAGCADKTLSETIGAFEYTELVPPSTLVPPGTIIAIINENPVAAEIVCTVSMAAGEKLKAQKSPTVSVDIASKTSKSFKIDASYMDKLKATAKYKEVKDVVLTLSNVEVYEVSTADLIKNANNREEPCIKAIKLHRDQKQKVTTVKSIIKGDVVYTVEFKSELEAGIKADIVKNLALELGFESTSASGTRIKGQGLIWGIRENQALVDVEEIKAFGDSVPEKPAMKAGGTATIKKKSQ